MAPFDSIAQDPWRAIDAEHAVRVLLGHIGEDVERDGLRDTPKRVAKAWREMTSGYREDPSEILSTCFQQTYDEIVALRDIEFYSTCEHHMLPFFGVAHVGYIPGKVVGISKLARLVNCFARRLQIQERLTNEVASAIDAHLEPRGVGVIIEAHHMCMGCRGVQKAAARMVTSSMRGVFLDRDSAARSEFLRIIGK